MRQSIQVVVNNAHYDIIDNDGNYLFDTSGRFITGRTMASTTRITMNLPMQKFLLWDNEGNIIADNEGDDIISAPQIQPQRIKLVVK